MQIIFHMASSYSSSFEYLMNGHTYASGAAMEAHALGMMFRFLSNEADRYMHSGSEELSMKESSVSTSSACRPYKEDSKYIDQTITEASGAAEAFLGQYCLSEPYD